MDLNLRKADSVLLPTLEMSAFVYPVSSERDSRGSILEPAYVWAFSCLAPAGISHQLSLIRHEDSLD